MRGINAQLLKTSGTDVLSSRKKLRKTLRGGEGGGGGGGTIKYGGESEGTTLIITLSKSTYIRKYRRTYLVG